MTRTPETDVLSRGEEPDRIESRRYEKPESDEGGFQSEKFLRAIAAMLSPMAIDAVAAGDGALRT